MDTHFTYYCRWSCCSSALYSLWGPCHCTIRVSVTLWHFVSCWYVSTPLSLSQDTFLCIPCIWQIKYFGFLYLLYSNWKLAKLRWEVEAHIWKGSAKRSTTNEEHHSRRYILLKISYINRNSSHKYLKGFTPTSYVYGTSILENPYFLILLLHISKNV